LGRRWLSRTKRGQNLGGGGVVGGVQRRSAPNNIAFGVHHKRTTEHPRVGVGSARAVASHRCLDAPAERFEAEQLAEASFPKAELGIKVFARVTNDCLRDLKFGTKSLRFGRSCHRYKGQLGRRDIAEHPDVLPAKDASQVPQKNDRVRMPVCKRGEGYGFAGMKLDNRIWHILSTSRGRRREALEAALSDSDALTSSGTFARSGESALE